MRFLAAFFVCAAAFAQVDTGAVSGLVTDGSGAVIPGASVVITQTSTNLRTELKTNDSGFYAAPALRPGPYEITVTHEGFRPQKSQPFDLRVQDRTEVSFRLEVGSANTEIVVSAAAPLLESETSSLGQVVEASHHHRPSAQRPQLHPTRYPHRRHPTFNPHRRTRQLCVANGARAIQNSYLLDGVDNKNRIHRLRQKLRAEWSSR